jgi:hypothetical protein
LALCALDVSELFVADCVSQLGKHQDAAQPEVTAFPSVFPGWQSH